ncbi:MAG: glycosyltransferase family 4 protein [Planctomycetota bacterium]
MLRVAIVTHRLTRTDGQGKINYELALRLAERGHRVELVSSVLDGPLVEHENAAWHAVPSPKKLPSHLLRNQHFAIGSARRLRAMSSRPDIIVVNGGITFFPGDVNIAMFVHAHWRRVRPAEEGGRLLQSAYHRLYAALNARWERRAFRQAVASVALAEPVAAQLLNLVGTELEQTHVIEPGVDAGQFIPLAEGEATPLRAELGIPEGHRLGVFVGDLATRRKNLDLVLRAMVKVPGLQLAVVGNTTRSPYPQMAASLDVADRVHFLGRRGDVPDLMRQADVFCFPSRYDPWALVVTEALASGIPVVVGPEVGAAAAVRPPTDGWLLDHAEDLDGMTSALQAVVREGVTFERRQLIREGVLGRTWDRMTDQYLDLFEKVMAQREDPTA